MFNTYGNDKLNDNIMGDDENPLLIPQLSKKPQRRLRRNTKRKQRCCIYMAIIIMLGLAAICLVITVENSSTLTLPSPAPGITTDHKHTPPTSSQNKLKTILFWNGNYTTSSIVSGEYRCIITSQPHYYGSELSLQKFDAIVFDAPAMNFSINHDSNRELLSTPRNPHQSYIYFAKTPPLTTTQYNTVQAELSDFYNLTWSYNLLSDIVMTRFKVIEKSDDDNLTYVAPKFNPSWIQPPTTVNYNKSDSTLYTTKSIAARIDLNAPCNGAKNHMIEELEQYMIVDVYGDCGESKFCINNCTKYYFYLAFENSHCIDYISNDFYTALEMNMVPVVFGGADYKRFAPPQSYINAKDYDSIRELIEYLEFLIYTPAEYNKYFWWHDVYEFIEPKDSWFQQCQSLCKILYENKKRNAGITNWWEYSHCQMDAKINE